MSRILVLAFSATLAVLATGCASITGSSSQSVSLQTRDQEGAEVQDAKCELSNDKGKWFVTTPGSVMIQKSNQDMQVLCKKQGYETGQQAVVSETQGAMYGNIVFGGPIGAVIDHNTGAAYEYPNWIRVVMQSLGKKDASGTPNQAATQPAVALVALAPLAATVPAPVPDAVHKLVPMTINGKKPQAGDEWEYLAQDNLFGKRKRLVWRVKNVETAGVQEELLVDGIPTAQWLFDDKPRMIGMPIDAGLMLGQHWNGTFPGSMGVAGMGTCVTRYNCVVAAKVWGYEQITVPAGTFEAIRIDGSVTMTVPPITIGTVRFWYSEKDRRLLKQTFQVNSPSMRMNETLELQIARTYQ